MGVNVGTLRPMTSSSSWTARHLSRPKNFLAAQSSTFLRELLLTWLGSADLLRSNHPPTCASTASAGDPVGPAKDVVKPQWFTLEREAPNRAGIRFRLIQNQRVRHEQ